MCDWLIQTEKVQAAGRLNLESWLHVVLPSSQTAGALAHLTAAGYDAHENGHGVLSWGSPEWWGTPWKESLVTAAEASTGILKPPRPGGWFML